MRLLVVVVFGMLWVGHVINLSKTFKDCIHNRKDYEVYQQIRERDSILVPPITRVLLHNDCALTWADENREAINVFSTVLIALFTFTLWRSTHLLWKAGDQQIEVARVSAKAAEAAVAESAKALVHARTVADRDFRPWLAVDAELVSEVGTRYSLEKREITFFIKLTCVNVGRVAASHIIYRVRGIDENLVGDIEDWFEENIWKSADFILSEGDALIPSERHVSRRWCRIPGPEEDSHWVTNPTPNRIGKFCVGIFVAYRGENGDERVFHTAKVLPVGDPNLVEFLPLISIDELPKGTGDVALGPVYVARAT